jgi:hypothetical protein
MVRDEAREWLVEFLLKKVREDAYPSTTHLDLIEQSIPCYMIPEYLKVLMDKVEQDRFPSIPMLRRIRRVAQCMPRHNHYLDRVRAEQAEAPRDVERHRAVRPGDETADEEQAGEHRDVVSGVVRGAGRPRPVEQKRRRLPSMIAPFTRSRRRARQPARGSR